MTVYQALLAAGVPLDHHESDLYVKVTPESTRLLLDYRGTTAPTFIHQQTRDLWYDVPFAFDPWWAWRVK